MRSVMINLPFTGTNFVRLWNNFASLKVGDRVHIPMPYSSGYYGRVAEITECAVSHALNGETIKTIKVFPDRYYDNYKGVDGPCVGRDIDPMGTELNISEAHEYCVTLDT